MKIHLYQLTKTEAFRLSKKALTKMGFVIHLADGEKGLMSGSRKSNHTSHVTFFDIQFALNSYITISLISDIFSSSTGTFIADAVSEELFLETFHDLLRIQPPDNALRLTYEDYAMAVGF